MISSLLGGKLIESLLSSNLSLELLSDECKNFRRNCFFISQKGHVVFPFELLVTQTVGQKIFC